MLFIRGTRVLVLVMGLLTLTGCLTPEKRARIERLKRVADEIPMYPDFKQVDYDATAKQSSALISCFYQSRSSRETVMDFYKKELLSREWRLEKEEPVVSWFTETGAATTFRKGNYKIILSAYSGSDAQFSLDFVLQE